MNVYYLHSKSTTNMYALLGAILCVLITALSFIAIQWIRDKQESEYRWKNLFKEIFKLQKAVGIDKEPSHVTPLDQQILDEGIWKSRYTPEQWAELVKNNGWKNGTGTNDTDQAPTGAATLPGGTTTYYSTACEEASRALMGYGPGYDWNVEREGDGYRWRLIPPDSQVELPRLNRSNLWHEHDYPYQVMVSRGGGSAPESFIPKTSEDHKKVDDLLQGEVIKQLSESTPGIDGKPFSITLKDDWFRSSTTPVEVDFGKGPVKWGTPEYYTQWINSIIHNLIRDGKIPNAKNISDKWHTFQELYDMRLALTIAMLKLRSHRVRPMKPGEIPSPCGHPSHDDMIHERTAWRSHQHSDGTMFEGMFIVGWGTQSGEYITFHYHDEHWDKFDFCDTLDKAPEWDGHTDKDVIERLLTL